MLEGCGWEVRNCMHVLYIHQSVVTLSAVGASIACFNVHEVRTKWVDTLESRAIEVGGWMW